MDFTRITVNLAQMGGVPCIRGLRIPVATVVGMVAEGMTRDEILDAYPDLEAGDIREAARLLGDNLPSIAAALDRGCIAVFDGNRIRVRSLPGC